MQAFHVSFPGLGIRDLPINRVAFSFELGGSEFNIYWYGIIIALAFLVCLLLIMREAPKHGLKKDDMVDMFIWIIILGLIGARLYYVAFSWDEFASDPLKIFQTRYGGLAFYGGLIGGLLGVVITSKLKKIDLLYLVDFCAVYVPLGQAIGRWGNFVNQEAFGTNTDLPWGMFSEQTYSYLNQFGQQYAPMSPVHPTFLYESLANIVIFLILHKFRKKSEKNGQVVGLYLILYGLVRFLVEGLRTDSLYVGNSGIRVSQALSLVFILLGLVLEFLAAKEFFGDKAKYLLLAAETELEAGEDQAASELESEAGPSEEQADSEEQVELVEPEFKAETGAEDTGLKDKE